MIWAITHINKRTDYKHLNRYWIECLENFRCELDLDIEIIEGKPPSFHLDPLISDTYTKGDQVQQICDLFYAGKVKDGDIFLFTDGWNFAVMPTAYMRSQFKINCKIISFWADSYFADSQNAWKRFYRGSKGPMDWAKYFEMATMHTADMSCFKTESRMWQFKRRYRSALKYNPWQVTGFPYEYIYRNGSAVDLTQKENIVVFPWPIGEKEYGIFEAMRADFPDWKFYSVVDNGANRTEYVNLLKRAKIVMSASRLDADITILFEALCYGCHLFLPDTAFHEKYFGEKYRYPVEYIRQKQHIKWLRARFSFQDLIQEVMNNYDPVPIQEDARKLKEIMFTDQPFLDVLEKCK